LQQTGIMKRILDKGEQMKRNSKENSEALSKSPRTVSDRIRTPFAGKVVVMDTEGSAPAPHEESSQRRTWMFSSDQNLIYI